MGKRKLVALSLAIIIALSLPACIKKETAEPGGTTFAGDPTDWMAGHENDAEAFAEIYPVSADNPFIIASYEEVVRLFKLGSGVLVFGFPDCPRCRNAFPALEKAFREMSIDKKEGFSGRILYFNIYDDREANNERYQTLVEYTKEFLPLDDDGNPRIYSPDVYFVNSGKIVGNHMDTVPSLTDPYDTLSDEQEQELIGIYKELIVKMEECRC